jgi:chaperonin cofactor prefoldin
MSQKSAQELQQMIEGLEKRVRVLESLVAALQSQVSRAVQTANRSGVRR